MTGERSARDWLVEGIAQYDAGRWDAADIALEHAVALDAMNADAWYRLGNVRQEQRCDAAATACYERAVALEPAHARAWNNLGASREVIGLDDLAEQAYRRAIAADATLVQALVNLANLRQRMGHGAEAAALRERAAALDPGVSAAIQAHLDRVRSALEAARAALARGERRAAQQGLEEALERMPGHPALVHLLAATRGETSAAPPEGYVAMLFDDFARTYDETMLRQLEYRVPELLAGLVRPELAQARPARVVDLGCGTGFVGQALAVPGVEILGIDISQHMLDRAAQSRAYARLVRGDVVEELKRLPPRSAHAVLAADVFVYIGDLQDVFAESARVLAAGGMFAFSTEALENGEFQLGMKGRYMHSAAYLRSLAARHGLTERHFARIHPRHEGTRPVEGWLACFQQA